MAINQIKAGFELTVFDTQKAALEELRSLGAHIANSAREVAEVAEIIGLSLRDDEQVETVMLGPDGVLDGARPGTVVAIHTTAHPATIEKLAKAAKAKGVKVIDAPVSINGADYHGRDPNATLCFMVGGDEDAFEKARPVFAASGTDIFHVGALGSGAIAKLAHQVICVGTVTAVAEGMLLADHAGISLKAFDEVLRHSAARSYFAEVWLERFKDRSPELVAVMSESVDPALKLARELKIQLPLTALGQQVLPQRVPVKLVQR
jgi:3-hydroxyisobutyrate dehydrogenase-like beta-hydroxyacid dehydrogenase